jgi:hypothetical protein
MIIIIEHISKLSSVKNAKCYLIKYSFEESGYVLDVTVKSNIISQQYINTYTVFNKLCAELCKYTLPVENYNLQVRIFSGKDTKKIFKLRNVKNIDKFNMKIINYIKQGEKPIIRLKKGSLVKVEESYLKKPEQIKHEEVVSEIGISINTTDKDYVIELEKRLENIELCNDVKRNLLL